ncbi:MFS transporter [Coleofasciculus sp. FACHB-1120]|uniref:MFS transporter n=1 Tax=Coleofasciculus sp. FACHB-1120 TaxID=2692783 RepID=UPI001683F6E4|nr:MFS transporter [Coleofasciculus sp. FACHB-1120]MBD2740492.1 MFS transporter [Coleofasciculus sp. FACHB-1120]
MSDSSSDYSTATPDSEKLKLSTKLAYGAGDVGSAITANIGVFYTAIFLTDVAGIAAGLATWILLIGKVWDAVNDPVVGVLSDRTNSPRWGRRLPWMLYGAIPFGITFFLQWLVPRFSANDAANQWGLFWYYIVISILFNSFYTAVNLPYTALTPELTQDYNERTNLNSYRFAFSIGGSIVSVIVFGIIARLIPNDRIQQYWVMGIVCAILSVLPIYWCIWGTRDRILARAAQNPTFEEPVSLPILQQVRIVLSNRPFLYVVGIYLCSWLAVQVTAAIIPYFVLSWMRLSDAVVAQVILAVQGTALLMLFIWSKLSKRYGKKAVYFMGMSVWIIAQAGLFFLQPGQIAFMYVLGVMAGFGVSTAYLIPWSMLPDVIELDELKTGQRREGIFYSFMVFLQKVSLAVAVALVLKSLEWNQYIPSTQENLAPIQPDSALLAIRIAIGPLPTIALICGLILAYFYPLTREVHADILLKLKERKLKAQ